MEWHGRTLRHGARSARIQPAHGCWFAVAYDARGQLSCGEYFAYGRPGSLTEAKAWCERQLRRSRMRKRR